MALGHPSGKLLHQLFIWKLAELLNDVLFIERNQNVVSGPGAIPSARGAIPATRRPKNSPFRAGPAAEEEPVILDSRIRLA